MHERLSDLSFETLFNNSHGLKDYKDLNSGPFNGPFSIMFGKMHFTNNSNLKMHKKFLSVKCRKCIYLQITESTNKGMV